MLTDEINSVLNISYDYAECFVIECIFRLLQRYQNVKAELEAQQNLERVRMEKLVQSGALTASRR